MERQKIVRLLVKEVLVGEDTITIRHSIPLPSGSLDKEDQSPRTVKITFCVRGVSTPPRANMTDDGQSGSYSGQCNFNSPREHEPRPEPSSAAGRRAETEFARKRG